MIVGSFGSTLENPSARVSYRAAVQSAGIRPRASEKFDIVIVGPVPPPYGGISVHVSRLTDLLVDSGLRVGVINHFGHRDGAFVIDALSRNPFRYARVGRRIDARVLHYHHSKWGHLVALAIGKRTTRTRYVLTLHAGDIQKHFPQLTSRIPLIGRITRWAVTRFDRIIAVDPDIAAILRTHIQGRPIDVIPAFLAPRQRDYENLDPSLEGFFADGRIILVAAYAVQFLRNGDELYGLDTAVDAFVDLAEEFDDVRLALFVAKTPTTRRARAHLQRLERQIAEANLGHRTRIVFGQPLPAALRPNSIFVRPTRAEGDAVSVREAQEAGVPVVASDVVSRPAGILPFRVGDVRSLAACVRSVLDAAVPAPSDANGSSTKPSFGEMLIALYRDELAAHDACVGSRR